ncbi:MAG: glycosyltransferase family 4 protein [Candidatus Krumholzibacteriota bacterium]|nr:glycosyltransferase family 4 protein [Candidatus Krumholzibacteriota bacterium]
MKIAILGIKGVPGHHGVEVVVDSLVPHLSALGHEITIYGYDSYCRDIADYHGARVISVAGSRRKSLEMVSHMWNASMKSRREDYDIVHIHSVDPAILAWLPRPKYGVIVTSHGQAYIRKKWGLLPRSLSKIAEKVFIRVPKVRTSVSKPLADYYNLRYQSDVIHIPNGIEIRKKPDESLLDKWSLKRSGFFFCSAGRIERTKGLSTLIDAYKALDTDIPLVIAGGGEATDYEYFEELKNCAPEGVKFTGFITGDDFFALYAHAKIFIFPSEYEAMSIALLEGLSFGTPTVYSDIPENEAVAAGIGFSFRVSDPADLAAKLEYMLLHPEEAQRKGERAMEKIRADHGWEAIARQYHELYLGMAEGSE